MILRADLHMHTTASDGILSPSQVVLHAKEKGLNCVAISDHDTMAGIDEALDAAASAGLTLIPALEISAGNNGEVHVLGYGISQNSAHLFALLRRIKDERVQRAQRMLDKLAALGMPLELGEIPARVTGVIGRPQIARAMVGRGYVKDVQEAFALWLDTGMPAYVERERIEVSDVIRLLCREGAVAVLAYPGLIRRPVEETEEQIKGWQKNGLMGLEAYHPAHLPENYRHWDAFARRHGLLVTGGSDFHAPKDPKHGKIGQMVPYWSACDADVEQLLKHLE